jgi:hypothetical protein
MCTVYCWEHTQKNPATQCNGCMVYRVWENTVSLHSHRCAPRFSHRYGDSVPRTWTGRTAALLIIMAGLIINALLSGMVVVRTSCISQYKRYTPSTALYTYTVHPVVLIHCTSPVLTSTRRRPCCINLESYFQQPPSLSSQLAFSSLRHSFFSTPFDRFIRRLAAFPFDSLPVVSFIAFHVLLRVLCFLYH